MSNINNNIQKFWEQCKDYVLYPNINQLQGTWDDNRECPARCCIAARFAKAFGAYQISGPSKFHYSAGINVAAIQIGISTMELRCMFWACGAPLRPFGGQPWAESVEKIFDRFTLIERVPTEKQLLSYKTLMLSPTLTVRPEITRGGCYQYMTIKAI